MLLEIIKQSIASLKANWLRSLLTIAIIAFGIMAVVGIMTAIDAAILGLSNRLNSLGANNVNIIAKRSRVRSGENTVAYKPINYEEAAEFETLYEKMAKVSLSFIGTSNVSVKYNKQETAPINSITGIDSDYLKLKDIDIEFGRNFTNSELKNGYNVALIGKSFVDLFFNKKPKKAIGKILDLGKVKLKIVGVLKSEGSSSSGPDGAIFVPLTTARKYYATSTSNFNILAKLPPGANYDQAESAAIGAMRIVRKLGPKEQNNFKVSTSESLKKTLEENTATLKSAALLIGILTMFSAAIGLMNIMLVSVTERTREIGISKSLGATKSYIQNQFLTEAILLTVFGGVLGAGIGILIGNLVSILLGGNFIMPWQWLGISLLVSILTGVVSGLYPAIKASRLDPIESLRYE